MLVLVLADRSVGKVDPPLVLADDAVPVQHQVIARVAIVDPAKPLPTRLCKASLHPVEAVQDGHDLPVNHLRGSRMRPPAASIANLARICAGVRPMATTPAASES